jgi:hypothetical protein
LSCPKRRDASREVVVVDEQKKKKVLVAALAVAGLGAGSFWYLTGESSAPKAALVTGGSTERKQVAVTEEAKTTRKVKDPKTATRAEPVAAERKEREVREEPTAERKKRREEKTKEKKKNTSPAA